MDEMWSFAGKKENRQWIWLAIDRYSRRIVGVHVGSRDRRGHKPCGIAFTSGLSGM